MASSWVEMKDGRGSRHFPQSTSTQKDTAFLYSAAEHRKVLGSESLGWNF